MNGRCENDALDAAVDVCDACGGEFCPGCLLFPNGPKRLPLCTACAIGTSGVRKAAKRERLQSRGSASKRRKELRKLAAEQQTKSLVVLDDLPNVDLGHEPTEKNTEEPRKKKQLRRKSDQVTETVAEHNDDSLDEGSLYEEQAFMPFEFEADAAGPDTASKMLDEIKTHGEVEQLTSESADVWNLPEDFAEPEIEVHPEPEPIFEAEYLPEPLPEAEPVPEPTPAPAEEAPQWEALPNPDASNPFDDPSVGRGATTGSGYETAPAAVAPPVERRVNRVPSPQHRSPSPEATQQWQQPQALPSVQPAQAQAQAQAQAPLAATPAPLVQPAPPVPKRRKMRDLLQGKQTPPAPVVQPEVVQERVQDPTTDTDAAGQWIPPNLRGMVASEQQTELPKRTRRG